MRVYIRCCLAVMIVFAMTSFASAQAVLVLVGGGNGTDIAITAFDGDLEVGALNLLSPGGYLVENPDGTDPFGTRIDALLPNQVAYAKLGGRVIFAEGTAVVMDIGYNCSAAGAAAPSDFEMQWDRSDVGTVIQLGGGGVCGVPEPSSGLLAALAGLYFAALRKR